MSDLMWEFNDKYHKMPSAFNKHFMCSVLPLHYRFIRYKFVVHSSNQRTGKIGLHYFGILQRITTSQVRKTSQIIQYLSGVEDTIHCHQMALKCNITLNERYTPWQNDFFSFKCVGKFILTICPDCSHLTIIRQ